MGNKEDLKKIEENCLEKIKNRQDRITKLENSNSQLASELSAIQDDLDSIRQKRTQLATLSQTFLPIMESFSNDFNINDGKECAGLYAQKADEILTNDVKKAIEEYSFYTSDEHMINNITSIESSLALRKTTKNSAMMLNNTLINAALNEISSYRNQIDTGRRLV